MMRLRNRRSATDGAIVVEQQRTFGCPSRRAGATTLSGCKTSSQADPQDGGECRLEFQAKMGAESRVVYSIISSRWAQRREQRGMTAAYVFLSKGYGQVGRFMSVCI